MKITIRATPEEWVEISPFLKTLASWRLETLLGHNFQGQHSAVISLSVEDAALFRLFYDEHMEMVAE